jgi:hypothetical protein
MGLTPRQNGTRPLQFTPGQLRDTVGLSVETYRHWKRVLPPFITCKGPSPCFSIGDLLAASILRRLTDSCGVRVGHLTEISKDIVRHCNTASWAALENKVLVIDFLNNTCRIVKEQALARTIDVVVLCPLKPIMDELREALLRSQRTADQTYLLFPPTAIGSNTRARGGRT